MSKDETVERTKQQAEPVKGKRSGNADEESEFKVEDRRHWNVDEAEPEEAEVKPRQPGIIDEYRERAEAAEAKLQEYIEAYKDDQKEQERFRERLERDVDRRVELKFGELVGELLQTVDDLDLGLDHVRGVAQAEPPPPPPPLAHGVGLARDRFLATLERHGIERITPDGAAFDPNEAEAMRMDPVDSEQMDGKVTVTLQPGYRLGERVVRPARVAVGRYQRK